MLGHVVLVLLCVTSASATPRVVLELSPEGPSMTHKATCFGTAQDTALAAWRRLDGRGGAGLAQDLPCAPQGASSTLARFAAGVQYELVVVDTTLGNGIGVELARSAFTMGDGGIAYARDGNITGAAAFATVTGAPSFDVFFVDLSLFRTAGGLIIGDLVAIDAATGSIVWHAPHLADSVLANENIVDCTPGSCLHSYFTLVPPSDSEPAVIVRLYGDHHLEVFEINGHVRQHFQVTNVFSHECYYDAAHSVVLLRSGSRIYEWNYRAVHQQPVLLFDAAEKLPEQYHGIGDDGIINSLSTACCDPHGVELLFVGFRAWNTIAVYRREPPHQFQWAFSSVDYVLGSAPLGPGFVGQHHGHAVEMSNDGHTVVLLMYDNHGMGNSGNWSRGVEYRVEYATRAATRVWDYKTKYSPSRGSAYRLAGGTNVVGCPYCGAKKHESGGVVFEVNADGAELARVDLPQVVEVGSFANFYRAVPAKTIGGERNLSETAAQRLFGASPTGAPTLRVASVTSTLPTPLPSSVPSALPSPLPTPLPSSVPSALPSPLPTSLPSPLPTDDEDLGNGAAGFVSLTTLVSCFVWGTLGWGGLGLLAWRWRHAGLVSEGQPWQQTTTQMADAQQEDRGVASAIDERGTTKTEMMHLNHDEAMTTGSTKGMDLRRTIGD